MLSTGSASYIPCDKNVEEGTGDDITGGDFQDTALADQCSKTRGGNKCVFHDTTYLEFRFEVAVKATFSIEYVFASEVRGIGNGGRGGGGGKEKGKCCVCVCVCVGGCGCF